MAQEYDIHEYWRQFDDNSRWRGFIENEALLKQNEQKEEEEDIISMVDYVLSRVRSYSVSTDDEQNDDANINKLHNEEKKYISELRSMPTQEENFIEAKNIPNDEIEIKLEQAFYQLKQNC